MNTQDDPTQLQSPSPSPSLPQVEAPVETHSASPSKHAGASTSAQAPLREGIEVHLGTTDTGKTYAAIARLEQKHRESGRGALVIDSTGSKTLAHIHPCATMLEAVDAVWREKRIVRWCPPDEAQFERVIAACQNPGGVDVLVDELSFWARSTALLKLCRTWRHANVTLIFTCQHVGADLAQALLGCNPVLYLYRITAPRSLEFAEKWLGVPRATILAQGRGESIEKRF